MKKFALRRQKQIKKRTTLGRDVEARYARDANCTPAMIRDVLRWGIGKNPSPERWSAYYVLRLNGKLP